VILSARALNPGLFVVARASSTSAEDKLARAGADRIVSPYTMAGRQLAQLAARPRVVDFLDAALSHGELSFSLAELRVLPGARWRAPRWPPARARPVSSWRSWPAIAGWQNPPDDRLLAADETLVLSGSVDALDAAHDEGGPAAADRS